MDVVRRKRRASKLRYLGVSLSMFVAVALLGWILSNWLTLPPSMPVQQNSTELAVGTDFDRLFDAAVGHMQRGEHQQALNLWHKVLLNNPDIPEVRVNIGFTLLEMGHTDKARDFFMGAIDADSFQANAYYGLALVSEDAGDLETAMGAMRSYIHLAGSGEDERFIRRARSALWEWETQLAAQRERGSDEPARSPQ